MIFIIKNFGKRETVICATQALFLACFSLEGNGQKNATQVEKWQQYVEFIISR